MVEWGGHHGGWGGFGPPSYIVKKCPVHAVKHLRTSILIYKHYRLKMSLYIEHMCTLSLIFKNKRKNKINSGENKVNSRQNEINRIIK